jgi:hypothetical protein
VIDLDAIKAAGLNSDAQSERLLAAHLRAELIAILKALDEPAPATADAETRMAA